MNKYEQAKEDNKNLKDISEFLSKSGKITEIIDTNKNQNIIISKLGLIMSYFLLIGGIGLIVVMVYATYMQLVVNYDKYTNVKSVLTALVGMVVIALIIIGVSIYEKNKSKLKISYINEKQMNVNNRVYNIETENCYISVYQKVYSRDTGPDQMYTEHYLAYTLAISTLTSKREFKLCPQDDTGLITIRNRTDIESLIEFVNNFKYDSDIPKLKIKQNMIADMYKKVNKDN